MSGNGAKDNRKKSGAAASADAIKVVAQNKKARHDYFIEQSFEAGIVLSGTEVKSVRLGKSNLKDSYAAIEGGEVFLFGMHISPYEQGNIFNKDPLRDRKLLLHRKEISRLIGLIQQKGLTIVPLQVYFRRGKVKIELGVARGKKLYDKREDIAEQSARREIDRRLKERANAVL
ncbi:MAG: SsrA-binding protein SmpB [Clostridiales bacterium]|jgi:SsrA-binding protein|nr:SsrA-binding protein SmpB [Clostridiales bacterium]